MTRARNIAGFSTITTTPSPVHVGPIGVLTATRIDGEFNKVDLATRKHYSSRNCSYKSTGIWNYNWSKCIRNYYCAEWNKL